MSQAGLSVRPRILVAEDDPSLRRLLELRLTVDGYAVRAVEDGWRAISAIESWAPAVLICDVLMPRLGGLTVCRVLRSDRRTSALPIVLLTARHFDEDLERVLPLGGITFLSKPFEAIALQAMLSTLGVPALAEGT